MSYSLVLDKSKLDEINKLMKTQKDTKVYKRLVGLKMKQQGISNLQISNILDVHIDTVTDWFKLYIRIGLKGLCELHLKNRKKIEIRRLS